MPIKPEGWRNKRLDDPKRHSDAARGIASGRKSDVRKPKYPANKTPPSEEAKRLGKEKSEMGWADRDYGAKEKKIYERLQQLYEENPSESDKIQKAFEKGMDEGYKHSAEAQKNRGWD
jgi:hypothetical protein